MSASALTLGACPICFEIPESTVEYSRADNHSWSNSESRCDGHGICWTCLQKHIEIQVLSDGKSNIRCPGAGCRYHLLQQDVERAMSSATEADKVLPVWTQLRDQSCQDRLWEAISADQQDSAARWVLQHCQPCPTCFTLARRENGCNHIVCRCGTDFCFGCGAPTYDGCVCGWLNANSRDGDIYFAAWLRSAERSPEICNWLWEEVQSSSGEPDNMDLTLAAWLWAAGMADLHLVMGDQPASKPRYPALTPLQWQGRSDDFDEEFFMPPEAFEIYSDIEDDPPEVCGHLRKEIFSLESKRMLQRKVRRRRGDTTHWSVTPAGDRTKVQAEMVTPSHPPAMKARSRRMGRSYC